jgi:hypothetical protein
MPAKDLIFDAEARRQLKSGIDALANAVKVTLGPRGRNVAIDKKWGAPTVTHDGVTVAKEIELENHFQNMGAQMLKQAATKTNDVAGDGTTTATVLAQAIVTEGLRNLAAGANPLLMKRGIDFATAAVVDEIKKQATPTVPFNHYTSRRNQQNSTNVVFYYPMSISSTSVMIDWASTVAVVVPSPTTSLVLVATSTSSRAPMFSKGSLSSISLATVTPSWVTVGAPNFLSIATLRPRGPSVVLTASATMSTPRLSARRASSLK